MPQRGSILDFRSDRSTSSKSFQKEIKKKEEEIKKKDDFIFEMKRQMDSMKEYLMNNLGYHGGTSNIDQGMSAPNHLHQFIDLHLNHYILIHLTSIHNIMVRLHNKHHDCIF